MADLIDRAALSKWLHETMSAQTTTVGMAYVRDFWNKVMDVPTIEAVEVPKDNVDDMNRAIIGLGIFRLSFCLNVQETDAQEEPVFRCEECPFEDKRTRKCAVKMFLNRNATEEQRNTFSPIV